MDALRVIFWALWSVAATMSVYMTIGNSALVSMFPEGKRWWHAPANQRETMLHDALTERDAALARMAALEKQELVDRWRISFNQGRSWQTVDFNPDGKCGYEGALIYKDRRTAGTSPVEPANQELLRGWTRYEKARKLNPAKWQSLCARNLAGENFDDMIDALPKPSTPAPIAQPSQARELSDKTWCGYVAGIIGTYLDEPVESDKVKTIAGIIERRLWALPVPAKTAQMQNKAACEVDGKFGDCWRTTCFANKSCAAIDNKGGES